MGVYVTARHDGTGTPPEPYKVNHIDLVQILEDAGLLDPNAQPAAKDAPEDGIDFDAIPDEFWDGVQGLVGGGQPFGEGTPQAAAWTAFQQDNERYLSESTAQPGMFPAYKCDDGYGWIWSPEECQMVLKAAAGIGDTEFVSLLRYAVKNHGAEIM